MKADWNTQPVYVHGCCLTAALKSVQLCILGTGNLNRIVSIVCFGGGVGFWERGGKTCTKQALKCFPSNRALVVAQAFLQAKEIQEISCNLACFLAGAVCERPRRLIGN